jgi:hypothetical protein
MEKVMVVVLVRIFRTFFCAGAGSDALALKIFSGCRLHQPVATWTLPAVWLDRSETS